MVQQKVRLSLQWIFSGQTSYPDLMQQRPLLHQQEQCRGIVLNWHNAAFLREDRNRLTFHPVVNNFLSLLGRALGEPVVAKQRRDLVGVHQLPRHEGQGAKRHLFIAQRIDKEQKEKRNSWIKQVAECGHESEKEKWNKTFSDSSKNICIQGQLLQS